MTVYYGRTADQFFNDGAFVGVRADGRVVTWGNPNTGGDLGNLTTALDGSVEVVEITSNIGAFAALLADGSVAAWGDETRGGDTSTVAGELDAVDSPRTESIVALGSTPSLGSQNGHGFASIREDGSVVAWGSRAEDGTGPVEYTVAGDVFNEVGGTGYSPVTELVSARLSLFTSSFVGLRGDGSVFSVENFEQFEALLAPQDDEPMAVSLYEFAPGYALFDDGSVRYVDIGSAPLLPPSPSSSASELPGVVDPVDVVSNQYETTVLGSDGSVAAFDNQGENQILRVTAEQQATELFANGTAFSALQSDGSVTTWSAVDRFTNWQLEDAPRFDDLSAALGGGEGMRVIDIVPGSSGFSALREDGSVVTWQISNDERDVFDQTDDVPVVDVSVFDTANDPMEKIVASGDRFVGLSESGQVLQWSPGLGGIDFIRQTAFVEEMGGTDTFPIGSDRDPFAEVVDIFSAGNGEFSILRADGNVVTDSGFSGDALTVIGGVDVAHSAYDGLSIGDVLDGEGVPIDPDAPPNPEEPEDPDAPSSRYQPTTEDLEIAARLVAYQRLGTDPEDYHSLGITSNSNTTVAEPNTFIAEQDYEFEVLSQGSPDEGFFAVGMTSPTAEPILAVRGSSNADDWESNFERESSGLSQVDESWEEIVDWIGRSTDQSQALNITGHSQGGAQTQYIASRLASNEASSLEGLSLGTLATFNSPGIPLSDAFLFDETDARATTHFVSSGDIVSLSGQYFIEGEVEYLLFSRGYFEDGGFSSFLEFPLTSHTGYWSQETLNQEIGAVGEFESSGPIFTIYPQEGVRDFQLSNSPDGLSSASFSYIDSESDVPYDFEYEQWLDDLDSVLSAVSFFADYEGVMSNIFAREGREGELEELLEEISPDLNEISNLIPNNGGLLNRSGTEALRAEYGDNFGKVVEAMGLIDPVYLPFGEGADNASPVSVVADDAGGVLSSESPNSVFEAGPGIDRIEFNGGYNVAIGEAPELNNDTISGFQEADGVIFSLSEFVIDQARIEEGSAIFNIDTDGDGVEDTVLTFEGDYDLDSFVVTPFDGGTAITYEPRSDREPSVPCFTPQSLVMTKRGLVPAGDICEGDLLVTRDHGYQPVNWIGRRPLSQEELVRRTHLAPILIRRGALGDGVPERDMMVSPQHKILWMSASSSVFYGDPEVFVAAKHLTYLPGIDTILPDRVVYLHFLFDQHEVVLTDGAWSESFNPGQSVMTGMDNEQSAELRELFPHLRDDQKSSAFRSARRSLKRHEAKLLA